MPMKFLKEEQTTPRVSGSSLKQLISLPYTYTAVLTSNPWWSL
jgi:hypothetical protein